MKKFIYLAGPIAGCDKGEANDWRNNVCERLVDGIIGISPLRCEPLIKERYDEAKDFVDGSGQYKDKRFGTPAAIQGKNWLDTKSCDLILAYLPKVSVGTIMEIAWGIALDKPIILVCSDAGIINHPLISENINWVFDNFDDALDTIHGLFQDYVNG